MDTRILEDVGLTRSEREIYLALLKTGQTPSGKLTKEVDMHRSRVYESLNRLMEKGLVSYVIKNGVKHFSAATPERLLAYVEDQETLLGEKKKELAQFIPELKKLIDPLKPEAEAHVLSGPEGFKTMRRDVLKVKKDIYMIGAKGKEYEALHYFFPQFEKLRVQHKIFWHILFDSEAPEWDSPTKKLVAIRRLPKTYSTPTAINIYGDRTVSVLWKGKYPLCFMIINKDVADSYRKWFRLLWEYAA